MKKNKICSLLLLLGVFTLFSCNQISKEEQEFDTLMKKIIDVHDEVMPKMGEMSSLIKDLDSKIDTSTIGKSYAKAQNDLKKSYDYMMDWMSDFSTKFPHGEKVKSDDINEFTKKMEILKQEEINVNRLRDQINTSIDNAKKLTTKQ